MVRKRTSPIWALSKEEFKDLVENSSTVTEIIKKMGLYDGNSSSYYRIIDKRIREDGLSKEHLIEGAKRKMAQTSIKNIRLLEEILVEDSTYNHGRNLKKRLIEAGMMREECEECGLGPEWNDKPLTLQIDHINGKHDDNRRENLRLLCPNCHTQTQTHSGANKKSKYKKRHYCSDCGKSIDRGSKSGLCHKCWSKTRRVERPTTEELEVLLKNNSKCAIARMYGVSEAAVRKWIKNND